MTTIYTKEKKAKSQDITERVKTFEDACEVLGIDEIKIGVAGMDKDNESITAYAKLIIIARALNEGWEPDWEDEDEYKYLPWFKQKSGFGLSFHDYDNWNSNTNVSSHLCLERQHKPYHLVKNKLIDKCFGIPNAFGRRSILKSKEK